MYDNFDDRHQRGWRKFEQFARRGMRGFPFNGLNFDGLEGNFRIGRMLASGDLRLVALFLIEQQPRHGYDMIKAVEEKTGGFYSPSPGIVYPALTFLEEAGYVTATADGNKKEYSITDAGRDHLAANRAAVELTLDYLGKIGHRWAEMRHSFGTGEGREAPEERGQSQRGRGHRHGGDFRQEFNARPQAQPDRDIPGVLPEVNEARRALKTALADALKTGDEDTQRRVAELLGKAARKVRELARPAGADDIDV